jgi:hypothetical protein
VYTTAKQGAKATLVYLLSGLRDPILCGFSRFSLDPAPGKNFMIFDLWIFSSNNTPGSTDSWAKAVPSIDSYSLRYLTMKIDCALCCIARSRFFFV